MSLYESFLLLNMFRMLLHSSSGADDCYVGVLLCFGVYSVRRVISECRLEHYTRVVLQPAFGYQSIIPT